MVISRLRDEEGGGSGASGLDTLGDSLEDGEVEVSLAGLLGVSAANNLGTCVSIVSIRRWR